MQKFNIAQGPAHNDRTWVVIDGQRTDSGQLADGAKVLAAGLQRYEAQGIAQLLNTAYLDGKLDGQREADKVKWLSVPGLREEIVPYPGHGPKIKGKTTP